MHTMTTEHDHVAITVPAENRLRLRREARNLRQEEVASQLGMTRQALRRLEAGENVTISPTAVSALATFYDTPETEIYQDLAAAINASRTQGVALGTVSENAEDIEAAGAERGGAA